MLMAVVVERPHKVVHFLLCRYVAASQSRLRSVIKKHIVIQNTSARRLLI